MSRDELFMAQQFKPSSNSRAPQSSISLFKEEVGQFVIETFSLIRKNVSQEKNVIEGLISALQPKLQSYYRKKQDSTTSQSQKGTQLIGQIQAAVEQLNRQSQNLCQRLFDLSQQLVQHKVLDLESQKQKIRQEYWSQLSQIKKQFAQQQAVTEQELNKYRVKCQVLQNCLNERVGSQAYFADQLRRKELSKYLELIQELSQEIQLLKSGQKRDNIYTECAQIESELNPPSEIYSERPEYRYNQLPYDQITHISKSTRPTTEYYENEYYQRANSKNSNPDYQSYQRDLERGKLRKDNLQREKNHSKEKHLQKNVVQFPKEYLPPKSRLPADREYIYVASQGSRDRGRSIDKHKDERPRPLIIYAQNLTPSEQLLDSGRRSENYRASQHQRLQQRNLKLEAVQEKLHGLKRTLSKELRNIHY